MTTLTDKHIAWLGKFAERVTERNSQLRFKPETDEQWAGVAFSVVEGMFTDPLETPPEGLPELSALDAEIAHVISEMAANAPDVESGDESAADVKAYWHGLFERYAAAKLADMTAQRDAECQARDAATKAYREGVAAAEQVTRRMELERNAAVRNCALTQSRYDALRLENERRKLLPQIEHDARETRDAALKKIRDDFQERAPHYTPPRGSSWTTWSSWMDANEVLHTKAGFKARFPEIGLILSNYYMAASGEEIAAALEARVYGRKP